MGNSCKMCKQNGKKLTDIKTPLYEIIIVKPIYKIVLIGDSFVGKSSFISRVVKNKFSEEFKFTVGVEFFTKDLVIRSNNNIYVVSSQIWDTTGQEKYRGIINAYYRKSNIVILMFSLDNIKTFDNLQNWIKEIKTYNGEHFSKIILVGTKSDKKCERKVCQENINNIINILNCKYFETSSLDGSGCSDVMNCVNEMIKKDLCDNVTKN